MGIKTIIKKQKLNIDKLKDRFFYNDVIYNEQIINFYRESEPDLKKTTINWRIYSLVQMVVLNRIGRGKYILGNKQNFIPEIHPKLIKLDRLLKKNFPFLNYCLWSTSLFNEFMLHQPGKFFFIVEVENDAADSVFYFLKESKYSVFLKPDKDLLNRYLPEDKVVWIIKSLVSESPVQNIKGIQTTTLEKLLVDLFTDTDILDAQQGAEKDRIFKEAFDKYIINENKLLRYAARRRKKEQINNYLNKVSKYRQQT